MWLFSLTTQGATARPTIARALAGDLALPVVAWFILKGIAASGRARWAWWGVSILAGAATYLVGATLFLAVFT